MFQSLFANSFAFCSFASESVWSAPAATPFTQREAERVGSVLLDEADRADHVARRLAHLLAVDEDKAVESSTVWNGMSPISSMPIMIMRATQKNRMS